MRVLYAEDDDDLAFALGLMLDKLGYKADLARDGVTADQFLQVQNYDLLILDLGLPRLDGLEVLRRLRARGQQLAVLVLTARDGVEARVRGLDAGADDYLVKPFAMLELGARLRALLRRGTAGSVILQHGALSLDTAARRVLVGAEELALTRRELALLELLLQRVGKVVSKRELVERFSDWDNALGDNAIEVAIFRLRRKLQAAGIVISTVRSQGYRMEEI